MSHLRIVSRDYGASLELRPLDRHHFVADATSADLHCTINVSSYLSEGIAEFFGDLATNWQGWSGTKTWQSLEGELVLEAKCDRLGHIFLLTTLRHAFDSWTAEVQLVIEAGQLDRLAAAAKDFGALINVY